MTTLWLILGGIGLIIFSIWMYGLASEAKGEAKAKEAASEDARATETDMANEMNKDISDDDLAKRYEERSK